MSCCGAASGRGHIGTTTRLDPRVVRDWLLPWTPSHLLVDDIAQGSRLWRAFAVGETRAFTTRACELSRRRIGTADSASCNPRGNGNHPRIALPCADKWRVSDVRGARAAGVVPEPL